MNAKQVQRIIDICQEGGFVQYALELNSYTRREQFKYRVMNTQRQVVKGLGYAAATAAIQSGKLARDWEEPSTSAFRKVWRLA